MPNNLVTIAHYSQPIEAQMAKIKLESQGIECLLANDIIVQMDWFLSNAVGNVQVRVRPEDAARAEAILQERDGDQPVVESTQEEVVEPPTGVQCPACGSRDTHYESFSRPVFFLSVLFLGFPLPFLKRTWKCRQCEYRWKQRGAG